MPRFQGSFLSRASSAFSSLAVSCALALLTLLALSLGLLQNSRADGVSSGDVNATIDSTALPVLEMPATPMERQLDQPRAPGSVGWISRRVSSSRSSSSPARELFGLSKVAFPLLVSDVVPVDPPAKTIVMSGSPVGVR